MDADPSNEIEFVLSKELRGLPPDQLTPVQNFVAAMGDLMDLVQNDESAVFEFEGQQKGFFHAGKKRADHYWHDPKPCVVPGCARKSITASHTLQRKGPLALVAENQHVLTPGIDRRQGCTAIKSAGIGEASTFPGFCGEHEQLFAGFEATGQLVKDEDIALQVFRSICREVVHKRAHIWELEHFLKAYDLVLQERWMKFMQARLGHNVFRRLRTKVQSIRIERGSDIRASILKEIETSRVFLGKVERDFLAPSHAEITGGEGGLAHLAIRVAQTLPVCVAGTANFGWRHDGKEEDIRVFVNVWPTAHETVVSITSESRNEAYLPAYLNVFADRPLGALTMIETWMVRGTDQWFIRPSVWNDLPPARQERILTDLSDTRFNIAATYGVSIFDEMRETMLASSDATQFAPEALEIESRKVASDR